MEKLPVLQKWTKILFIIGILILFFVPGVILMALINPEMVPFEFTINDDKEFTIATAIIALIITLGWGLFIYALHLFRKVLALFSKKKIFDSDVIVNLRKIGQFIWYGLLVTAIPGPAYRLFNQESGKIKLSLDVEWISYVLFTGSLALFFMVLSEVFQKAKNIKEENDLTV